MTSNRKLKLSSLDDLKLLSTAEVTTWLKDSARLWSTASDEKIASSSFFPVMMSPDPATDVGELLARRLAVAFANDTWKPAEGAVSALEGWRLLADGQKGAALLVRVATELASSRLFDALDAVIAKADARTVPYTDTFSDAVATAAVERLSRDKALEIGMLARRMNLMSPADAARILSYACTGRLDRLASLAQGLRLPAESDPFAAHWLVTLLLASHTEDEIRAALDLPRTAEQAARNASGWILGALGAVTASPIESAQGLIFEIITKSSTADLAQIRRNAAGTTTENIIMDINPAADAVDPSNYIRFLHANAIN